MAKKKRVPNSEFQKVLDKMNKRVQDPEFLRRVKETLPDISREVKEWRERIEKAKKIRPETFRMKLGEAA